MHIGKVGLYITMKRRIDFYFNFQQYTSQVAF